MEVSENPEENIFEFKFKPEEITPFRTIVFEYVIEQVRQGQQVNSGAYTILEKFNPAPDGVPPKPRTMTASSCTWLEGLLDAYIDATSILEHEFGTLEEKPPEIIKRLEIGRIAMGFSLKIKEFREDQVVQLFAESLDESLAQILRDEN